MNVIQYMTDANGKRISVVIPIELFNKLIAETNLEEFFASVPYEVGDNDEETVPHDVVKIRRKEKVALHTAWRIYRGLSQAEVAKELGITQAGVSAIEQRAKPQRATLEKLAKLYHCRPEQLYLD